MEDGAGSLRRASGSLFSSLFSRRVRSHCQDACDRLGTQKDPFRPYVGRELINIWSVRPCRWSHSGNPPFRRAGRGRCFLPPFTLHPWHLSPKLLTCSAYDPALTRTWKDMELGGLTPQLIEVPLRASSHIVDGPNGERCFGARKSASCRRLSRG